MTERTAFWEVPWKVWYPSAWVGDFLEARMWIVKRLLPGPFWIWIYFN